MPFRLDETDPQLMVLYTGTDEPQIAEYQAFYDRWAARLQQGDRFGVVIVYEPRVTTHGDQDNARDGAWESAYSRLVTKFRNANRDLNTALSLGFARVLTSERARAIFDMPERVARMNTRIDRYAQYMYGVPGRAYPDLKQASVWLKARHAGAATAVRYQPRSSVAKVGLYYGSTTGMTEYVAEKVAAAWEAAGAGRLEPVNISYLKDLSRLVEHERLVLGIPTWNIGQLQDDWEMHWQDLSAQNLRGKRVAIFGIGDQINYAENFLDAVGLLADLVRECGAELVGSWPVEGYDFTASKAQEGSVFCGLGIDEVNQEKLTDYRVVAWVEQVIGEFALDVAVPSFERAGLGTT